VFEIQNRTDGQGNCLRQMLSQDGIGWSGHKDPKPETVLGDLTWKDYIIAADVLISTNSYAALMGRITLVPNNSKLPACYYFQLNSGGHWELRAIQTALGDKPWCFHTTGDTGKPLAEGDAAIFQNQWHHLELGMAGDRITISIDERILAVLHDSSHLRGQAGLGCGWRGADIANFLIKPDQASPEFKH